MTNITERIEREAGVPGLASILAERLSAADLGSLLLEVYRLRGARREPSAVLTAYEHDGFVRPAGVSPHRLAAWEQAALSHLPTGFDPLALSPVCPLGAASALSEVSQDWVVTTTRGSEVVSDSTNVLALECALRRRALMRANPKSAQAVHLAASHRLIRAQNFSGPHSVRHFSIFALCSAGRDQGNLGFEFSSLMTHIRFYLDALRGFLGPDVPLEVSATDFSPAPRYDHIETHLLGPLRSACQGVPCIVDQQRAKGRGYYTGLCFHIRAKDASGQVLELVDGGCVNWTQQLLSSAKERLVISGISSERVCTAFEQVSS